MLVRGGVGAVVGCRVDCVAVGATVPGVDVVWVGAAVVGAAVRIWMVGLADGDAEALGLGEGDGDADAPARRDSPPPKITPMRRSVRRPPATAARMRSTTRGPRRGGGMILVVSDIHAQLSHPACRDRQVSVVPFR